MAGSILIKGGTLVTGAGRSLQDILVEDGRIAAIAPGIEPAAGCELLDARGLAVTQGFADLHVHFREPGFEYKETIRTGSMAAAAGGYTLVCAMPNLSPVPDSPETLEPELKAIERDAVIDVRPYASITMGRKGLQLTDFAALKGRCAAFSDDGSGVQSDDMMLAAMELAAKEDVIIAAHCEDNSLLRGGYIHDGRYCREHGHKGICSESEWRQIERDLRLAEQAGCRYHVCHISTAESVELIRQAKRRGVRVTCETGPHYLALCEDDLREEGRFKMNPPLRAASDREALVEGLLDGTIDAIATDHAPHSAEEKSRGLAHSAMGITGLETAFAVLYTALVQTGRVPLERVVEALTAAPRRIFGLGPALAPGAPADLTLLDLNTDYTIDSTTFLSKGHATPFDGLTVTGKVLMTINNGNIAYEAGGSALTKPWPPVAL